ncbi:uncharacterized protein LOC103182474 isoform X2 [Callorhinchus milii]|uniref:uncharacterized protein LOC103182474 isoform X2 n=1 Tax=Callorhinchus milii TaxID=7868 RepID=UPI001C3F516F|nr:uncharacterized protein LOC103182474 isoform X2 [Callorhinchus milii]
MVFEKYDRSEGCTTERLQDKRQENQKSRSQPPVGPHTPESSPPHASEAGHRGHGPVSPSSSNEQRSGCSGASPIKGGKGKMNKGPDKGGRNRAHGTRGEVKPSSPRKSVVGDPSCKLQKPPPGVNPLPCQDLQSDVPNPIALHPVLQTALQQFGSLQTKGDKLEVDAKAKAPATSGVEQKKAVREDRPCHQPPAFPAPKVTGHAAFKSCVVPSADSLREPAAHSSKPRETRGSETPVKRPKPMQGDTRAPERKCSELKKRKKPEKQEASRAPGGKTPAGIGINPSRAKLKRKKPFRISETEGWRQKETELQEVMGFEEGELSPSTTDDTSDDDIFREPPKTRPAKTRRSQARRAGHPDQPSPELLCNPSTDRARILPVRNDVKKTSQTKLHTPVCSETTLRHLSSMIIYKPLCKSNGEVKAGGDEERRRVGGLSGSNKGNTRSKDSRGREATGQQSDSKREALREARTAAILARKDKLEEAFHWDCKVLLRWPRCW